MSKNYAETLTYWYLRLNGFFPLNDFVLHWKKELAEPDPLRENMRLRPGEGTADCDILCIRFPNVYEEVGGKNDEDWDVFLRTRLHLLAQPTALIVQVKDSGECDKDEIQKAFMKWRIEYAMGRLGLLPKGSEPFENAVTRLTDETEPMYREPVTGFCIAKLAVTRIPCMSAGWLNITLGHALGFLKRRLQQDYKDEKKGAWIHFPDDLLQYLIWEPDLEREAEAAPARLQREIQA